jgi:putative hydrolase of the HAD superfamily
MIQAVTFDLWWTIFEYREATLERKIALLSDMLGHQGLDRDRESMREAFIYSRNLFDRSWKRAKRSHSPRARVEAVLDRMGVSLPAGAMKDLTGEIEEAILAEPPNLVHGVAEAIDSLSQAYTLGIISDTGMTPGRVVRTLLDRAGLLSLFSSTLFSDEVGCYKPHAEIFKLALRDLAVLPAQAVHIGDDPQTDVRGAKGVGMKAILFNRSSATGTVAEGADVVIGSYDGLMEIVHGL